MWISNTFLSASGGGTGKFYRMRPESAGFPQFQELTLPTGYKMTNTRPSVAGYNGRAYYAGVGSDDMLVDEHYRVLYEGLLAPNFVPVLAAGAGTGITGSAIVAVAEYDMFTDEWSPLSASSNTVVLANQNRATSSIPSTAMNPRATHIGIFVSMDGAAFRLATKRQIGVTSVTEAVATLSLASISGITSGNSFSRFPRCSFNTFYHDRQIKAGDSRHPDTVYVSEVAFPERYTGLSFKTRAGEPVVALVSNRDVCLVFTPFSYYALRGYTDQDMTMTLVDGDIGCMSHHTCKVINDRIYWANDKGVWMYNGAPHFILKDHMTLWQDAFQTYQDDFENAFAAVNPNDFTYSVYISGLPTDAMTTFDIPDPGNDDPQTVAFVCDYSGITPEVGGSMSQPDWTFDVMDRAVECSAVLALPGGRRRDAYFGHCDGIIRKYEYDPTVSDYATDDDDAYDKVLWLRTKAYDFDDPGGDIQEGKAFHRLWSYLESPLTAWTIYCKGGDQNAHQGFAPDNVTQWWKNDVSHSQHLGTFTFPGISGQFEVVMENMSVFPHLPEKVSGRCLVLEYYIVEPKTFRWKGFGGMYRPGVAFRQIRTMQNPS